MCFFLLLWYALIFHFDKVQFTWSFVPFAFLHYIPEMIAKSSTVGNSLVFSSKDIILLPVMFRSLIHLEFIFVYDVWDLVLFCDLFGLYERLSPS